jgi:hypothetical protein
VPSSPVELGALVRPGYPSRVAFDGRRAYLANGHNGLTVVDLSNPAAPLEMGTCDPPEAAAEAVDVALAPGYALVADASGGLRVVNVANPLAPHEVGWYQTGGAVGVDVRGDLAFLSTGDGGLVILDVGACTTELFSDSFESGDAAAWSRALE